MSFQMELLEYSSTMQLKSLLIRMVRIFITLKENKKKIFMFHIYFQITPKILKRKWPYSNTLNHISIRTSNKMKSNIKRDVKNLFMSRNGSKHDKPKCFDCQIKLYKSTSKIKLKFCSVRSKSWLLTQTKLVKERLILWMQL